ncbi:MAG: hypothetical protein AABW41_05625, partial [Nanoarchaeota archaeon]
MVKLSKLRNIAIILVAIAIIAELIYFSRLTGFVAVGNEISYTDSINMLFNEDSEYNWTIGNNNFESIKSIKLNGYVKGNGVVKVYIENNNRTYLLLNSKSLKDVNKITGFAIEKNDKKDAAVIENNISEATKQTDVNLTNITIANETFVNTTQNKTVQISDNTSTIYDLTNLTNLTQELAININNITTSTENLTEEAKEENKETIEFTSVCIDTCNIDFSNNIYKIIVQVNNAELYLDSIEYSIVPINISTSNQTELNYTHQNITSLNESLEDIQLPAEINKPVKWIKRIKSNQSGIIKVSVKKEATNIIVKRLEEENEIDVSEKTREINKENETELEIDAKSTDPKAETSYSIEYETPPPEVAETNLPELRKIITVSSDLHYTNVLSYTKLPLEVQNKSIRLYWLVNESRVELKNITYLDENNNTLIDSIQWVIPGLSNQTFELSLIILNP